MWISCFRNVFCEYVLHDKRWCQCHVSETYYVNKFSTVHDRRWCQILVHTVTRSFPHHTQCQMLVHTVTRSFPHHTQCLLTNPKSSNVCWWFTRWPEVFHITHNVCWRITQSQMSVDESHGDPVFHITLNTTMSNVCRQFTRWSEVFHSALITTISASCPHHTQYLQLQYLWLHNYQIKNIDVNYHKQSM